MSQSDFDAYIAQILQVWMDSLQRKLQAAIIAENLLDKGKLYESLRAKVLKGVLGATAQASLDMKTYGRMLDIKRPSRIVADTNDTRRALVGVGNKGNRGRSWYNKTVWAGKKELGVMLMGNIEKMSRKDFLNWIQS